MLKALVLAVTCIYLTCNHLTLYMHSGLYKLILSFRFFAIKMTCWKVAERMVFRAEVLHTRAFHAECSRRFIEPFVYMFAVPHQVGKLQGHDYHKYYYKPIVFR